MRTIASAFGQEKDSALCDDVFMLYAEITTTIDVRTMSPHERVVSLAWHFGGIIDNGGFGYLYTANIAGDPHYRITADAFRVIGCERIAAAFEASFGWFTDRTPPVEVLERRRQFSLVGDDERTRVERLFFAESAHLGDHLGAYIRAHRHEIAADLRARMPGTITRHLRIWKFRLGARWRRIMASR